MNTAVEDFASLTFFIFRFATGRRPSHRAIAKGVCVTLMISH
jgi:hypothetical protein